MGILMRKLIYSMSVSQERLNDGGLRVVGTEQDGEARVVELPDRRFYLATLFVPQLSSQPDSPHPLIVAYLQAAVQTESAMSLG